MVLIGVNILDFNGKCPFCHKDIDLQNEFRDVVSIKEYFISGLCQHCQDIAFAEPVEPEAEDNGENKVEVPFGELPFKMESKPNNLEENIKKVETALSKIIKDIKLKLPDNVFDFNDFYIAGGCIYSIWNDKPPKDYDIFCKNKKALAKVKKYFKENSCNYKSENAITYGKYQFVTKWYGDAVTEVGKFDFKHNMFYYDSEGLHNLVDWNYLDSNKLVFNNLRARDVASVLTRIPKFIARGMDIDTEEIADALDVVTRPRKYIKERISIKRIKSKGRSGY